MSITKTRAKEPRRVQIVRGIKEMIKDGAMRPGDRLPTEQALAKQFGVSRISVREATKALEYFGLINSAPKRGLTVGRLDLTRVGECLDFHAAVADYPREQLLRTRVIIEMGVLPDVMQAMVRDPGLYDRLYALTTLPGITTDAQVYIDADVAFHSELVKASGIEMLVVFNDILRAFFARYRQEAVGTLPETTERGIEYHRRILAALRDGELAIARELLHFTFQTYQR